MGKTSLHCGRWIFYDGPIYFLGFPFGEQFVQSGQGFGSFGKNNNATGGSIQSMDQPQKDRSGFVIFLSDVILDHFRQWRIACLIALDNISRTLVDNKQMIVLKKNLKIVFGAM